MSEYPERLYLQIEDDGDVLDDPSDWTHCDDRVNDSDVTYVRGDIVDAMAEALRKLMDEVSGPDGPPLTMGEQDALEYACEVLAGLDES